MAAAEYHHGDMEITEQQKTFSGFMRTTVWGSGLTAVVLVFLTLHYTAAGLDWFVALGVAIVLGILIGLALGMKGAWYGAIFGLAVIGGVIGVLAALVGLVTGG